MRTAAGLWMFVGGLVALAALYLLFVGQLSFEESGLALASGVAAALLAASLTAVSKIHFRFEPAAAAAFGRAMANIPVAAARVAAVFLRAIASKATGSVIMQTFMFGRDRDPAAVTRRAVAILAVSLAPDRFALCTSRERREIKLHTLVKPRKKDDPRWLT